MFTLNELDNIVEKGLESLDFRMEPVDLYQPIEYMISIGGKRLRPIMCLMTYNLFTDKIEKPILYPALALEIFHGFTLIHDDIMDNADIRRGQPTVYKKWNNNIAILSGDVMSIKSYELLANCPNEKLSQVLSLFSKTAAQVCEGQQYDMNFEEMSFITMDDYISMIGLKTAVLLACSSKMGAIIAGADKKVADSLYDFGYNLGIAFQIQDDYLDTFGQSNIFGKNIGGDILNNKKTWLLVESFKRADSKEKEELDFLLSLSADKRIEKIAGVQNFYTKMGIKEAAEHSIAEYHKKAMTIVESLLLTSTQKTQLETFAHNLLKRDK
ncbi:MAG: polyprenyl synthetase family protein [Bacteroidales bacterium]